MQLALFPPFSANVEAALCLVGTLDAWEDAAAALAQQERHHQELLNQVREMLHEQVFLLQEVPFRYA